MSGWSQNIALLHKASQIQEERQDILTERIELLGRRVASHEGDLVEVRQTNGDLERRLTRLETIEATRAEPLKQLIEATRAEPPSELEVARAEIHRLHNLGDRIAEQLNAGQHPAQGEHPLAALWMREKG